MYRVTGDDRYVYPIVFNLLVLTERLRRDLDNLADPSWIDERSSELLDNFNERTRKGRLRRELFERNRSMLFYLRLLASANKIASFGLDESGLETTHQRCVSALREVDFASFLLDPEVIRVYSPQAVNHVYSLHRLGIADIRAQYTVAFRAVFADERDGGLSEAQFSDKIYGMTHFILAASDYYQRSVNQAEFSWILEYLDRSIETILAETKPDVVAEVGICFLLAGEGDHRVVGLCRESIVASFDTEHSMILSTRGSDDLAKGEHRNVIAHMLLEWPGNLHPGPFLAEKDQFRELFPRGLDH